MVQRDLFGPETRGLVKIILGVLRDFDLIHKKMKHRGEVNFEKKKIYYQKDQGYCEGIDTLLHEFVHVYRDCYLFKDMPSGEKDEIETMVNAIYWARNIYENLKDI